MYLHFQWRQAIENQGGWKLLFSGPAKSMDGLFQHLVKGWTIRFHHDRAYLYPETGARWNYY